MRNLFNSVLSVLCLTLLFSCNNKEARSPLSKDDSVSIFNDMVSKSGKSAHDTTVKLFFADKLDMMAPKPWKEMRNFHLDYLENPLPLFSSAETSKKVRYFEVPLRDIQIIQGALGTNFGGLRIYMGYDKTVTPNAYRLILVGVKNNTKENHLKDGEIFDDFIPCPKVCLEGNANPTIAKTDLNYDDRNPASPVFRQPR